MPLEFALRPRLTLERPAPKRWFGSVRLSPVALPIAGYWLAMAAATYGLLQLTAQDPSESAALGAALAGDLGETAETAAPAEPAPAPPEPAPSPPPSPPLAATPAFLPPVHAVTTPEPAPQADPAPEPEPRPSPPALAAGPAPSPRPAPPRAERKLARAPEPPALAWTAPARDDEPAEPPSEHPRAPAAPERSEEEEPRAGPLPSCESAAAQANQSIDMGGSRGAPDLPREAFAAVLDNGGYLTGCALPSRTALEICAAVQHGKVIGVSVASEPRSPALNACVRRKVAGLRFPRSERIDVTRTRFAPSR